MRSLFLSAAIVALLAVPAACAPNPVWQQAVDRAARTAPAARILVLDIPTGRLLAAYRLPEAAHTLAAPGSTLKPLVLYQLIAAGRWNPSRRVACDRNLYVAGHRLACPHPPAPPFDAQQALAWSCNTYFAQLALTLAPGSLGAMLRQTGLLGVTGLAPAGAGEAAAEFHEPASAAATQLALLGVDGVRVSPLELAVAYRWLANQLAAHPDAQAAQVVRAGLADSAAFGMARPATQFGASVAGKTGTAASAASSQTHGWFVGLVPAVKPQVVVVVCLPSGRGADAAHLAAVLLAQARVN